MDKQQIVMQDSGLNTFKAVISRDIPNLVRFDQGIDERMIEDFRNVLRKEAEQVKINMTAYVTQVMRKKQARKYVRQQQQDIILLNSSLTDHAYPEKLAKPQPKPECAVLCHYVYKTLENLLSFMENHFTGYFDLDAWLPMNYRLIAVQEAKEDIENLETLLIEAGVDYRLSTIIFLEFWQFVNQEVDSQLTWRKVRYLKVLKLELARVVKHAANNKTDEIRLLLISLNFNNPSFFTYYTNYIISEFNSVEDANLKFEKLSFCMKEINQVRDRPGFILDLRCQPIKEQIALWIAEELNFHQSSQLSLDLGTLDNPNSQLVKIEFDMSVAQVSCLLYGLVQDNAIKNANLLDVFRTVSAMIKTRRAEKISPEGLRVRYYNIEYTAKVAVIDRLRAIANFLERN